MTLKDLDVLERRKLTRSYPVLISSMPGQGKSSTVEFLPAEDKKRTIVFDTENKGFPEDDPSDYRTVYRLKPTDVDAKSPSYKDVGNIKYLTAEDTLKRIQLAIAHPDVDRIIIDSFTALVTELERRYMKVHNGFNVWNTYNDMLHDFFAIIKEETYTHGKFTYVLGHYTPQKNKKDPEAEYFTKVSGNAYFRLVESQFNTVITIEDFKFKADNTDIYNSTRIKRSLNPYESNENSLQELEHALTGIPASNEE